MPRYGLLHVPLVGACPGISRHRVAVYAWVKTVCARLTRRAKESA